MSSLITIGKITGNQGNKGEVKVHPLTDYHERFNVLNRVFLQKEGPDNNIIEKNIENVWYHKNKVIIKFENVDAIDQAISLQNYYIKIDEESILPLEEDQYYIYKIIDYEVETVSGKKLGKLEDVLATGGADIFMVRDENKNQYMIPATKEIIKKVDKSVKKIIIKPIPGLLDLG